MLKTIQSLKTLSTTIIKGSAG